MIPKWIYMYLILVGDRCCLTDCDQLPSLCCGWWWKGWRNQRFNCHQTRGMPVQFDDFPQNGSVVSVSQLLFIDTLYIFMHWLKYSTFTFKLAFEYINQCIFIYMMIRKLALGGYCTERIRYLIITIHEMHYDTYQFIQFVSVLPHIHIDFNIFEMSIAQFTYNYSLV